MAGDPWISILLASHLRPPSSSATLEPNCPNNCLHYLAKDSSPTSSILLTASASMGASRCHRFQHCHHHQKSLISPGCQCLFDCLFHFSSRQTIQLLARPLSL